MNLLLINIILNDLLIIFILFQYLLVWPFYLNIIFLIIQIKNIFHHIFFYILLSLNYKFLLMYLIIHHFILSFIIFKFNILILILSYLILNNYYLFIINLFNFLKYLFIHLNRNILIHFLSLFLKIFKLIN